MLRHAGVGILITIYFCDRESAELVYHRLPWKEPDAPYLLEILYEDNDVVKSEVESGLFIV